MKRLLQGSLIYLIVAFTVADNSTSSPVPTKEITQAAADRYGNIYICDKQYNITKYSPEGQQEEIYSPQRFAEITSFEAWSSINLLLFYKDYQEYVLLDRFLTAKGSATFNPDVVGFARVATLSYDNNIWLIDDQDFSLKKYDIKYSALLVNNPLDLVLNPETYDIASLREYQNNLYANDKNSGILVFDNLGNYKKTIPAKGIEKMGFYKEELYYLAGDTIHFHGLYLPTERKEPLPESLAINHVLLTDNAYYFFEKNKMHIRKR